MFKSNLIFTAFDCSRLIYKICSKIFMKYKGKIMKTERNKIVPTEGSQISLQRTHSAAMGLQVEGEEDEQHGILRLCL